MLEIYANRFEIECVKGNYVLIIVVGRVSRLPDTRFLVSTGAAKLLGHKPPITITILKNVWIISLLYVCM